MNVRIAYFPNFNSANTILICGDEEGLQRLADNLRPLEDPNAQPVNLNVLPFVQVHGDISLTAYPVDRELGVRQIGSSCFDWRHSQEGWLEATEKIEAVARAKEGHYYLGETAAGEAVVMVSKGKPPCGLKRLPAFA
jgi:hypothetical protein